MRFHQTGLSGAYLIELELLEDERGFFARTFCREEFAARGLNPEVAQCNLSYNARKNTLRGMHYQAEPHAEAKLVNCLKGAVYDVIIDLRPRSSTSGRWVAVELSATNRKMLYVPEGFAHGFLTLEDDTAVHYQMSAFFEPDSARGVRWDDPAFGIEWPCPEPIISDKDQRWPDYKR